MVFVNTGSGTPADRSVPTELAAKRVAGDAAEIAFDAVPGQIFQGKVISVLDALAAGQILPSGGVQDFKPGDGRALARIKITTKLPDSARLGGAGCDPYAPLPSHCAASAYSAADEELAELRLSRGTLKQGRQLAHSAVLSVVTSMSACPQLKSRLYDRHVAQSYRSFRGRARVSGGPRARTRSFWQSDDAIGASDQEPLIVF